MIPKCENCGARLPRLNFACSYCNHWTADPAHPLPNPAYAAPAATTPAATTPAAPAPAPAPAAPAPAAPAPAAPAPAAPAVMTPMGPPVVAAATPAEKTPAKAPEGDAAAAKRFGIRRADAAPEKPAAKVAPPAEKVAPAAKPAAKVAVSAPEKAAASKADLFRSAIAQTGGETWGKAKAVRVKGVDASSASDEDDAAVAYAEAIAAAVYYVCTADEADDDEMDGDEYDGLVAALGEALGYDADEGALEETMARWDEEIDDDWEGFLAEIAQTLGDERAMRDTLHLAVTVAAADGELSSLEEEAAYDLGDAMGLDEDACERIIERAVRKATG